MNKENEVECECGAIVKGNSKLHAEANLKEHKTSKKHKELMEIKKRLEKCQK
jgi:hypothetical protein